MVGWLESLFDLPCGARFDFFVSPVLSVVGGSVGEVTLVLRALLCLSVSSDAGGSVVPTLFASTITLSFSAFRTRFCGTAPTNFSCHH